MTVHSDTFGPVQTGIVSDIKLLGAVRLQRRLEPRSTTSATGPRRCVPPPCGTTAQPCPGLRSARTGTFRLTPSWLNHVRDHPPATLCGSPFLVGPRAGSHPWRHRSPSPPSRVSLFTLRGLLQVRGLSGGFQAAATELLSDPTDEVCWIIVPEGMDVLQFLDSSSVLMHSIREYIQRKKSAAVGATLVRRCRRRDELALGWESLGGRFFRVPSFVLVGSVSLVSWPFFAGSLHVVVSLSRRLLPAFCSLCCLGSPRLPETDRRDSLECC